MEEAYEGLFIPEEYVFIVREKPTEMKKEEWDLLDCKALGAIGQTLSSVVFNIKTKKAVASLVAALSIMHEQPFVVNKVYLMKKPFRLKMLKKNLRTILTNLMRLWIS